MRVLVCGGREWGNKAVIAREIDRLEAITRSGVTRVIHGDARGADTLATRVAEERGIPVDAYPAKWDKYGKAAGPVRNGTMLEEGEPQLVLAFHHNLFRSKGTKNMVLKAMNAGVPVRLISE